MDKKTKTIIVVVLVVGVIGGLYYGVNRWREQRLANQILKEAYGLNTGVLGGLLGGSVQEKIAKEMAKEAAKNELQQAEDEAKEAAKTPEDRYDETEEMATYDDNSKFAADEARKIIEKVFGKTKLVSVYSNAYGSENSVSSMMEFKISRLATGADLSALNKALTDKGLPIIQSGIADKTATVMSGNDNNVYSFGFEIGEQTVNANIMVISE
ncbi:hypothetical protein A2316_02580 [Candidatus Falkowbacteria bacterium RIFOXYB2_FULL_38_15]|uniref:Uncharacterized protein n=1 Tax=Candidatus Falkowbacteria bacterium RIFOXYA2_FULL_38_12 TaxID=1797993 RepID=A0A1F5S2T0_9BACT|nr:MAG: hypothetical protein A2257_03090 [Candidatus Falkowbacteria bacterium RIFOXYA2_FULL_38_12]OGF32536.1 MAG: hypothetical protein A2316_02580 [Candidatus Falkowbacteria bacterium RIFOXYB2_FULL_38_15]OGF41998.1 MAG: hypothetical protein A2555_04050 [Candidatus Falkowbacteria bacterium RIFOXYD2_FULL_39_16]